MLRAVAAHPTRPDLAAVGDELPQQRGVLVIDVSGLVLAEGADLLLLLAGRCLRRAVAATRALTCTHQNGGSSRYPPSPLAVALAGGDAHGSSAWPPPNPPPPPPPLPPPPRVVL